MPMPQITWDDVQQMPDDGNRYEVIGRALQGVAEYRGQSGKPMPET